MKSRWSDSDAKTFLSRYAPGWGEELALRLYTARLLGADQTLVLHGGGNTSVKATHRNILGDAIPALFIKASGRDLERIEPEGHPAVDLEYLCRLRALPEMSEAEMVREIRTHLFDDRSPTPSIETLVHAFLAPKFIDHTHADAILALTNQVNGEKRIREALGEDVIVLPYAKPGFELAQASARAYEAAPQKRGMVWMHHGIVTWGETARDAYETMIDLVSRAESYLEKKAGTPLRVQTPTPLETAQERWIKLAPILRGCLADPTGDQDRPYRRRILVPLINRDVLDFVDSTTGRELALGPPLTSDHLIRTKPLPLWIDAPRYDDESGLHEQIRKAVQEYRSAYRAYAAAHSSAKDPQVSVFDPAPRVILIPGLGVACAGAEIGAANICRDITAHTLQVKRQIAAMGGRYQGLGEKELYAMEYYSLQHAKLAADAPPFPGCVALVTGAAGAIGSGICQALLQHGCHVAVTDLPGERLDSLVRDLESVFKERVLGVPLDVTSAQSVAQAFSSVISTWGGIDLVIPNAGAALVSSLNQMRPEDFRRLEQINVEGTLNILSAAARHFETQGTGGDIVLISTKNVFSPGPQFGAYSATKAAAHQLARIASLELAPMGVRVNMVSPDAIFGEGARRSGLWAEVGPERMRARGMNEEELEEYYRQRNLLKLKITTAHVANAVLFFASRQTPTTGATLPVDGGLPDATPR